MRILSVALLLLAAVGVFSRSAQASDWMFRPSYYTHNPPQAVRVGQQPLPRYSYGRQFGGYIRTGFYLNRISGNNLRSAYPILQSYETWVQGGSQW